MAISFHVTKLKQGVSAWNDWWPGSNGADLSGEDFSGTILHEVNLPMANLKEVDFGGADLSEADLRGANLTKANLRNADLRNADLSRANLEGANLHNADLKRADLQGTKLKGAKLTEADLSGAQLIGARVSEVDLAGAILSGAKLIGLDLRSVNLDGVRFNSVDLTGADLRDHDLRHVTFSRAILVGTDFRGCKLQFAKMDGATLTEAKLWETLRAGWSIKGVICQSAFWDRDATTRTEYGPREFEKHHSDQRAIEIIYRGGITRFELNTLPALIHHLESTHSGSQLRLRSIEDAPGGTKVVIVAEETAGEDLEEIKEHARQLQTAQMELRDERRFRERLEIERALLLDTVFPRMLEAVGKREISISHSGPVGSIVIDSPGATASTRQVLGDVTTIKTVLDEIVARRAEFASLPTERLGNLEAAIEAVQRELVSLQPNPSAVREGLKTVRNIVEGAIGSTVANAWWPAISAILQRLA